MSREEQVETPVYALGQPSRRTGLGGLSMKTTIVLGIGFLGYLVCQIAGFAKFGLLVVVPVALIIAGIVSFNVGGRSMAQMAEMMFQDMRQRTRGEHIYFSGPSSRLPGGTYRLPGVFARTELVEGVDAAGKEFAVIFDRPRREATVVLHAQLSGETAITQDERNAQTSEWGRWLAGLSLSGDVEQAAVVVTTRPGTGDLVAQEVAATVKPEAPWIARQVQAEAAELLSQGVPEVDAHISLTFSVSVSDAKDTSFVELIGTRLPSLYGPLTWAGIQASPMDTNSVCARAHMLYNPASEADFEELSVQGIEHGLGWEDIGPSWAQKDRSAYHHDGATSVTWEMAQAPRSTFEDTLLTGLIQPHIRIARKRVALIYRPYEAGSGAGRVEAEHRDAMVAANSSKKIRAASADMRLEHTEAARRAQARGAQLGRYSLFVTATCAPDEDLERIKHDVEQLGAQANIRLRVMTRQQDAAFATSCGLGQTPWAKPSTSALAGA
ncbi:SCO6880 family protein [Corynebacterium mucifaciens]|uniref:PrgI family protein n=1 Tax=Corynebacterium mucifaciens TaxID=57171 RepID=A0A7X6LSL0_9CORY|nr:SCO6880 family protein [Corynebacterium mucifaciens]NKY69591.1 hypothetical protein [Corynebacterium mucifaciens]